MRRRFTAMAGALALAVLVPTSIALADTIPPTGKELGVESTSEVCDADGCTSVTLDVYLFDGVAEACLAFFTATSTELGCTTSVTLLYEAKYIVGIGSVSITIENQDTLATRSVTVAASHAITGPTVRTRLTQDIDLGGGCVMTRNLRVQTVLVAGSVTVSGTIYPTDDRSFIYEARDKTRCA